MHGDYHEDPGMTTALVSDVTVSSSFINTEVKLLCLKIFFAVTSLC